MIRLLREADAEFILTLLNDPDFVRNIADRGVRTAHDARRYIREGPLESYTRHGFGLYLIALKEDDVPIGICGLLRRAELDDVDVGYALLPGFRGRGYAYEAAAAMLEHARALRLGRLLAIVSPHNEGSIRILTALGFSPSPHAAGRLPGSPAERLVFAREL